MTSDEVAWAWAAGFFEGEGSITLPTSKARGITLYNYQRDMIDLFQSIVNCGNIYPDRARGKGWIWYTGKVRDIERVLGRFMPWLSEYRQERAHNLIAGMANVTPLNERTHCPRGHPKTPENIAYYSQGRRVDGKKYPKCLPCMRQYQQDKSRQQGNGIVRQWAVANGYTVSFKGPIPYQVRAAYDRATA